MAFPGIRRTAGVEMQAVCDVPSENGTPPDASMSDEAFRLINCFYDGVDNVVRDLAEEIAMREGSYLPGHKNVLAIEVRHVLEAGRQVVDALRGLLKSHSLPRELEEAIQGMGDCFENSSCD